MYRWVYLQVRDGKNSLKNTSSVMFCFVFFYEGIIVEQTKYLIFRKRTVTLIILCNDQEGLEIKLKKKTLSNISIKHGSSYVRSRKVDLIYYSFIHFKY